MRLIEVEKVEQAIKDYWKAQVDKALTLTFIDGNEANKRINSYIEHNHDLLKLIDELTSAEPDTTTHDSIPAETGKNDGDKTSGDYISRTQAIDALRDYLVEKRCPDDGTLTCRLIENEVINKLPSVQPERKTGRWIPCPQNVSWLYVYKCSECGGYLQISDVDGKGYKANYCSYCGAKMEGGEADE